MHIPNPAWGTELITHLNADPRAGDKYIVVQRGAKGRLMHLCWIQENQQRNMFPAERSSQTKKKKNFYKPPKIKGLSVVKKLGKNTFYKIRKSNKSDKDKWEVLAIGFVCVFPKCDRKLFKAGGAT